MVLMVMTQCLGCPCAALASTLFSSAAVHQHGFAVQVAQLQNATAVDFAFGAAVIDVAAVAADCLGFVVAAAAVDIDTAADADTDTDVFDSTDAPTTVISA